MPTKKKTKSKQRKASAPSSRPVKKASNKKLGAKTKAPKKPAKNKGAQRKAVATTSAKRKKPLKVKTARQTQKRIEDRSGAVYGIGSSRPTQGRVFSGRQSGDLQGLSRAEEADSESVEELLEEGNPFEAEVVTGVESADEADEHEVRTHEAPEDDVPDEYLDKD
jgi:hypothetical protein